MVYLSHLYMTTRKSIPLTMWTFVGKVMSLLFHMLSGFVVAFLPRRKCLLFSCLQPPSTVILKPKKTKCGTISTFPPSVCHEVMTGCHTLRFFNVEFQASLFTLLFSLIKRLFSVSSLSAIRVISSAYLRLLFLPAILIPACDSSSPVFCMMYSE